MLNQLVTQGFNPYSLFTIHYSLITHSIKNTTLS